MSQKYIYKMGHNGNYIIVDTSSNILIRDMFKATEILNEQDETIQSLQQSREDAWSLLRHIYDEICEDGSMDFGRIKDLVEFDD